MSLPTKQEVRTWLHREVAAKRAPQSPAEIRRQLGWTLIDAAREAAKRSNGIR